MRRRPRRVCSNCSILFLFLFLFFLLLELCFARSVYYYYFCVWMQMVKWWCRRKINGKEDNKPMWKIVCTSVCPNSASISSYELERMNGRFALYTNERHGCVCVTSSLSLLLLSFGFSHVRRVCVLREEKKNGFRRTHNNMSAIDDLHSTETKERMKLKKKKTLDSNEFTGRANKIIGLSCDKKIWYYFSW